MAPFGLGRGFSKKKNSVSIPEPIYENRTGDIYTLSNDGDEHHHVHTTAQVPVKQQSKGWGFKSVLKRKNTQPEVIETIEPLYERSDGFLDENHPIGGVYRSNSRRLHESPDSSSLSEGGANLRRTNTGGSLARSIQPYESASNIGVTHVIPVGQPLHGIVEEASEGGDYHSRAGSPITMMLPPEAQYSRHSIGRGMHIHQGDYVEGQRLAPLEVTDAHGRRQKVTEVILDGSGLQEIPMPADGNVIFIVEEGVTLEVKDPETGDFIPLEEYYARLASRPPPKPQERYIVVNGDASNIIVEDADGQIIHRGDRVTSQYLQGRGSFDRRGSRLSHVSEAQYSQHVRHPSGTIVVED